MRFFINAIGSAVRGRALPKKPSSQPAQVMRGHAISPVCGCVAEVSLSMSDTSSGSGVVENITIDRTRLLIGDDDKPIVTTKGNILLRNCNCKPLASFAGEMEYYAQDRTLDEMRNSIFRSGVPVSFARTVRRKNRMPLASENCLRLLNEAMCDALGGSSTEELTMRSEMRWPRPGSHQFYLDDDEDEAGLDYYDAAAATATYDDFNTNESSGSSPQ